MKNSTKNIGLSFLIIFSFSFVSPAFADGFSKAVNPGTQDDSLKYKIISKGALAGKYQAFPDALRLKNGEIIVSFYAGDRHVTPNNTEYPKAGRICMVRSRDEGKTWTEASIIYDDDEDNRDGHLSQLSDGTLICSFFNLRLNPKRGEVRIVRSKDNGATWEKESQIVARDWFCSSPTRELPDGTLMQPIYTIHDTVSYRAGFIRSRDKGKTWDPIIRVGQGSDFIANETDFIQLKDGSLFAALRGGFREKIHMHTTSSKDLGKTWSPFSDIGFYGDAPSFTRLKSGEILLTVRGYKDQPGPNASYTALYISNDEAKNWQGPYMVDKKGGAYSSTIELKNNNILIIYYEEGEGSAIRAVQFEKPNNLKGEKFSEPKPIKSIAL